MNRGVRGGWESTGLDGKPLIVNRDTGSLDTRYHLDIMPDRPPLEDGFPPVELRTMGVPMLTGTTYRRPTGITVLAYLLLEGATTRSSLRALFWPDGDQAGASLRVLLSGLKRELPTDALRTEGQTVSAYLPCDAITLLSSAAGSEHLYLGPFLQGIRLPSVSPELKEWVEITRERLALEAQRQLLLQGEQARSVGEVQRYLERCLRLPGAAPLEPEMLQRMLALAPPGSEIERAIRRELLELDPVLLPGREPSHSRLLGRDRVLAGLLALLATGEPVIELTGPGGIGKTSLLRALLQEVAPMYGEQVAMVDLEDVLSSAEVASHLAAAMGLQLPSGAEMWTALGEALAESRYLIALDGAEHLDDLTDWVGVLLGRAPRVQVVVGSRRRLLRLGIHHVLEGLDVPAPELDTALIHQSASVRLFMQAATEVVPSPPSDDLDLRMVAAIVRRLDGHPLAIRLAALELAEKPVATLYQQILHDRLSVAPALQSLYRRARSGLTEEGRLTLSRLAVLPTMNLSDAGRITGVGAGELAELQAHSFLNSGEGRIGIIPVLRELAAADLPFADPVQARHAETFLSRLTEWPPSGQDARRERANIVQALQTRLEEGGGEVAQVEWVMAHFEQQGLIVAGLETLNRLASGAANAPPAVQAALQVARAWLAFRSALFQDAEGHARALIARTDAATRDAQMKGFNILYAVLIQQLGRTEEAITVLRRAIELAQELGNQKQKAMYLGNLCAALIHQGDYAAARQALDEAKQLRATQPPGPEDAMNRFRELSLRFDSGEAPGPIMTEAQHALSGLHRLQAEWMAGELLIILGKAAGRAGQLKQMRQAAADLEAFSRDFPSPVMHIASALLQAEAAFAQQDTPSARSHLLRGTSLCLEHDEQTGALEVLLLAAHDLQWHGPELSRQIARAVLLSPAASAIERREAVRLGGQKVGGEQVSPQIWLGRVQQLYERVPFTVASVSFTDR